MTPSSPNRRRRRSRASTRYPDARASCTSSGISGICAYGFRYSRSRREILAGMERTAGLALAGDYLFGHNMEGCLQSSLAAVSHLLGQPDAYDATRAYPTGDLVSAPTEDAADLDKAA